MPCACRPMSCVRTAYALGSMYRRRSGTGPRRTGTAHGTARRHPSPDTCAVRWARHRSADCGGHQTPDAEETMNPVIYLTHRDMANTRTSAAPVATYATHHPLFTDHSPCLRPGTAGVGPDASTAAVTALRFSRVSPPHEKAPHEPETRDAKPRKKHSTDVGEASPGAAALSPSPARRSRRRRPGLPPPARARRRGPVPRPTPTTLPSARRRGERRARPGAPRAGSRQ